MLTLFIKCVPLNNLFGLKIVSLTPKMVENIFRIIYILTAAKNYTRNFSDTPLGPDYCTSSKASLTGPSNQPYFQCIFKIFQTFGTFFIIFIFILVKLIRLWKWIAIWLWLGQLLEKLKHTPFPTVISFLTCF